jgi:hypothetical protein
MEGHHKNKCPTFKYYLSIGALNPLGPRGGVYCEICKMMGHHPNTCPLMQKYHSTTKNFFCNFCKFVGHDEKGCRALDLMREHIKYAYIVQG